MCNQGGHKIKKKKKKFFSSYILPLADIVCNQGGHKIKKKKKFSRYIFKKYEFVKMSILIFVLEKKN